jgi:CheY-like chemotaxis protein
LAQLLGGDVYVKSELGMGSTFVAVIPNSFQGETEVVYVPEVRRDLDSSRMPVLVVEDNREALFVYEKYLKGSAFQVIPANNIKEARAAVASFRPLAIVLDVLLQGEHSWDFLRDLKKDPETQNIPVYVITVVDNREKALNLGADGFHTKPVDRLWLLKELQSLTAATPASQVLVIDDDETSRYLIESLLAGSRCTVLQARGGMEGLRMARQSQAGLIVLDLGMEDLSGFDVLQELKADPRTANIPVIIHTSKMLDDEDYARIRLAVDVIPKSIMSSREIAAARFHEAFKKAGLASVTRNSDQPVSAE